MSITQKIQKWIRLGIFAATLSACEGVQIRSLSDTALIAPGPTPGPDTTAPLAATTIAWVESTPENTLNVNASWVKSTSVDLAFQYVQYYQDGTCTTPSGGLINLNSTVAQTAAFAAPSDGTYSFKVTSMDAAFNSSESACSGAMLIDRVNPSVTLTAPNGGQTLYAGQSYNITWTPATDTGGSGVASTVDLTYTINAGAPVSITTGVTNSGGTYAWTVPNDPSALVRVQVIARDQAGNSLTDGSDANFTIAAGAAPSVPTHLAVTAGYQSIVLNWTASSGTPTPTYEVLRSTTLGSGYTSLASGLAVTTYTDSTAVHGTTYFYVVRASNAVSTSANSAPAGTQSMLNPTFALDYRFETLSPQIGTQNFVFQRTGNATTATHFGRDGLLRYAPHNLLQRSEAIVAHEGTGVGQWEGVENLIQANAATAPDGNMTAEKIYGATQSNATQALIGQRAPKASTSLPITCSTFVKAAGHRWVVLKVETNVGTSEGYLSHFDLVQGVAGSHHQTGTEFGYIGKGITAVGNSWYRIHLSVQSNIQDHVHCRLMIVGADSGSAVLTPFDNDPLTTNGVYAWGFQVEQNRTPSVYLPTTGAARQDGPRFEYDPATREPLGLRLDENSTNSLTYSEDFSQAAWSKVGSSISTNTVATTDPMGGNQADSLVEDTANSNHIVRQSIAKAASAIRVAGSVFVKAGSRDRVSLELAGGSGGAWAFFDLTAGNSFNNGTWGSGWTAGSIQIRSVGNGWYWIRHDAETDTTATASLSVMLINGTTTTYLGNGTGNVYVFGAQLERVDTSDGNTMISGTHYIPTEAAAVSRAQEYLESSGGLGSWYTSTGTWYVDWKMSALSENGTNSSTLLRLHAGGSQDYRLVLKPGFYVGFDRENGARNYFSFFREWVEGNILGVSDFRGAFTYSTGDTVARLNGLTSGFVNLTDSIPVTPTTLSIGTNYTGHQWEPFTGWIREIRFYPVRLNDATLTSMTSQAAAPGFVEEFESALPDFVRFALGYGGDCHWCNLGPNIWTIAQSFGRLIASAPVTGIGGDGLVSADTYNLTGAWAEFELIEPGARMSADNNNSGCGQKTVLSVFPGSGTTLQVGVQQYLQNPNFLDAMWEAETSTGNWSASYFSSGGAYTSNPQNYRFFRIRHDSSTDTFFMERSPNRWTWTSVGPPLARFNNITLVHLGLVSVVECQDADTTTFVPAVFDRFRTNAVKNP